MLNQKGSLSTCQKVQLNNNIFNYKYHYLIDLSYGIKY